MSGKLPIKLSSETLDAIDYYLEELFESKKTENLGNRMKGVGLKQTQIRGLETLIVSTTRFSEIINYVKNQTGKDFARKPDKQTWAQFGSIILDHLNEIQVRAQEIVGDKKEEKMEVKLRLANGWARQVVASYLYGGNQ